MAMAEENSYDVGRGVAPQGQDVTLGAGLQELAATVTVLGEKLAKLEAVAMETLGSAMRSMPMSDSVEAKASSRPEGATALADRIVTLTEQVRGYDGYIRSLGSILDRVDLEL